MRNNFLLCLDEKYNLFLGNNNDMILFNYETMIDNLVDLLKTYGIEDAEILEKIKDDTDIIITKMGE